MANNRIQIKRTNVSGRTPNTTNSANSQYIAAGEFALNMVDQQLYTSDGSNLITIGAQQAIGTFSDSIFIGNIANNLLTINSTAIFAGNLSLATTINTTAIAIQNTTSSLSVNPLTLFVGNTSTNVTVDMTGGNSSIAIASASIDSNAVVTIQTTINHGITTVTQSKLYVNTSQVSLNTANYSTDYNPIGFDIRSIPTPNTISFTLPNDSFVKSSPGNRTITSISRNSNGLVTVTTAGPHLYANGDIVYASGVNYTLADFYISGGSVATVINSTTLTYTQNNYASANISLIGANAGIYTPPVPTGQSQGPYYFYIDAADPVFNGYVSGGTIVYGNLPVTNSTSTTGNWNNYYSPSYFNGSNIIYVTQVNQSGRHTLLTQAGVRLSSDPFNRFLYPTNPVTLSQGYVIVSYVENGKINNNSQLCPVLPTTSIGGTIIAAVPTGISIKNGNKLVYVLDSVVYVGNTTVGNIVDSKGSRAFKPSNAALSVVPPSFNVSATTVSANEGDTFAFIISTSNFGSGTLYWTNDGTCAGSRFTDGLNYGAVTISNDYGAVTKTTLLDKVTEGPTTVVFNLRNGSTSGPILATAPTVTINDTSVTPIYNISSSASVNEGSTITFTITTQSVDNGTTLYWTNGGTAAASRFSDNLNYGSFVINNGSNTVSRTLVSNYTVDGATNINFQIRTGSITGPVVASQAITVNDTSVPTYSITPTSSSVNEGNTATFNIATVGVPSGTTLYWKNSGTADSTRFTDNLNFGQVIITNNVGVVIRTPYADGITDGSTTIVLQLYTDSTFNTLVATSTAVTVNDTSTGSVYSIVPTSASVNEGSSITFNINTKGVPNNTTLYWKNLGTAAASRFNNSINSGSFIINGGSNSVTMFVLSDGLTEGPTTIEFHVYTNSNYTGDVGGQSTVTINDISKTANPTYQVAPTTSYGYNNPLATGSTVTYTITTTGVPNGTTLYYNVFPSFIPGQGGFGLNGGSLARNSVTINNNTASFTVTNNIHVQNYYYTNPPAKAIVAIYTTAPFNDEYSTAAVCTDVSIYMVTGY